jgi:hypothetical protein
VPPELPPEPLVPPELPPEPLVPPELPPEPAAALPAPPPRPPDALPPLPPVPGVGSLLDEQPYAAASPSAKTVTASLLVLIDAPCHTG